MQEELFGNEVNFSLQLLFSASWFIAEQSGPKSRNRITPQAPLDHIKKDQGRHLKACIRGDACMAWFSFLMTNFLLLVWQERLVKCFHSVSLLFSMLPSLPTIFLFKSSCCLPFSPWQMLPKDSCRARDNLASYEHTQRHENLRITNLLALYLFSVLCLQSLTFILLV